MKRVWDTIGSIIVGLFAVSVLSEMLFALSRPYSAFLVTGVVLIAFLGWERR
jgi:hypothetical protein